MTTRVVIAIPTLGRRPLDGLLRELNRELERKPARVLLVHNGAQNQQETEATARFYGADVVHVEEAGFASARNVALEHSQDADILVFVDDDEIPLPGWLDAHLDALNTWQADVSFGPVDVRLPTDASRWLGRGEVLRQPIRRVDGPTGADVYSGNTAIDLRSPALAGARFDSRFNSAGGEDTEFFDRVRSRGARIVWTSEASVQEVPDDDRLRVGYILHRAFDAAQRSVTIRPPGSHTQIVLVAVRKASQGLLGAALVVAGVATLDSARLVRGLRHMALAAGVLKGLLGHRAAKATP